MVLNRPLDELGLLELGGAVGERLALEGESPVGINLLLVSRMSQHGRCEQSAREELIELHVFFCDTKGREKRERCPVRT